MASVSTTDAPTPTVKRYRAVHIMHITDVGSRGAETTLFSPSFTCAEDPQPVSFKMKIVLKDNKVSAHVKPQSRSVQLNWLKFGVFYGNMNPLRSRLTNVKMEILRHAGRGFDDLLHLSGDPVNMDLNITCEIDYNGVCDAEPSKCQCTPVQASNLRT